MKSKTDIATGVVTMLLAGVGALSVRDIDTPPNEMLHSASFPELIVILLFLCGACLVWQGAHLKALKDYWPDIKYLRKMALFILWFCIYVGMVIVLGEQFAMAESVWLQNNVAFGLSTFIYLVGALLMLGRRKLLELMLVAAGVPVAVIFSFSGFFKIMLP